MSNNCKYFKTARCTEFLNNLNVSCDGQFFYDGQGHVSSVLECPIKKENDKFYIGYDGLKYCKKHKLLVVYSQDGNDYCLWCKNG